MGKYGTCWGERTLCWSCAPVSLVDGNGRLAPLCHIAQTPGPPHNVLCYGQNSSQVPILPEMGRCALPFRSRSGPVQIPNPRPRIMLQAELFFHKFYNLNAVKSKRDKADTKKRKAGEADDDDEEDAGGAAAVDSDDEDIDKMIEGEEQVRGRERAG